MNTTSQPASWSSDFSKYAARGVRTARLSGHNLIAMGHPLSPGLASVPAEYAHFLMTIDAKENAVIEIVAIGDPGRKDLAQLAKTLGCEIPTEHGCAAPGELHYFRLVFALPDAHVWQSIDLALRSAGMNVSNPVYLPTARTVSVRVRGPVLLSNAERIPAAPTALVTYLQSYGKHQQQAAFERAVAQSASAAKAVAIPKHAMKMRYGLGLMFNGSYLSLTAGFIVTESDLLRAIAEIDAAALVPLDGETSLPPLKPGEIRFKRKTLQNVPGLGNIDAAENHVVGGTDELYITALRRAGIEIEVYAEPAPAKTRKLVTA